MGHTRLGELPSSHKWKAVVTAIAEGGALLPSSQGSSDDIEAIAQKTLDAAQGGLVRALDDEGLRYLFLMSPCPLQIEQQLTSYNLQHISTQ